MNSVEVLATQSNCGVFPASAATSATPEGFASVHAASIPRIRLPIAYKICVSCEKCKEKPALTNAPASKVNQKS